ncbi:PREDICTED: uncharacterized protein LOC101821912 isoform X2 [Ficedula albicollis]|uniref:uncharacterized protein LOC101821912 isoform X2 n=1 Tax=Ficedula albicollis TaxID=59894 RepID=UPI0007AD9104|nr:PREDICTED: uncharacterized protein LOC101821912 isoform X2 [Ficedula albicollis]
MGGSVSALEKATVDSLMSLAKKKGETFNRSQLVDLLYWAKRRGFLKDTVDIFAERTWQAVGADLWEAIQTGNKEAKTLASTYRQLRQLIERLGAEAEVGLAAQTLVSPAAEKLSLSPEPLPPVTEPQSLSSDSSTSGPSSFDRLPDPPPVYVAAPAQKGPYDDLIPPWEPPPPAAPAAPAAPTSAVSPAPSAPPADPRSSATNPFLQPFPDPASVPLPDDMDIDVGPDASSTLHMQLAELTKAMVQLLAEMKRLDKGSSSQAVQKAYRQAHDAIVSGLKTLEDNSQPLLTAQQMDRRRRALQTIYDHAFDLDTAQHFLKTKQLPVLSPKEAERWIRQPEPPPSEGLVENFARWLKDKGDVKNAGGAEDHGKNECGGKVSGPSADPSFNMVKRWKGIVTNAELTGDFQFVTAPVVAAPIIRDASGNHYQPLNWNLIAKVQKSVIDYGVDNCLVRRQVEAVLKYQELVPADIKTIFELILGPTSYMLFLNKWQERLANKQLENLHLPDGDPLRYADLDMLMGQGQFLDPERQAMLHVRILAQSKAAALEAFSLLPQVGKSRQPYLQIRQDENEAFLKFVDRVKEGVESAPDIPHTVKDTILKEIILQNANMTCKRLLATLHPDVTILQMIEICSRAPMESEKERACIHTSALAAALTKANAAKAPSNKAPSDACYNCGHRGHTRKHCPLRLQKQRATATVPADSVFA